MRFRHGDETVTLRGYPSLGRNIVSSKSMIKTIKQDGSGILVKMNRLEVGLEFEPGVSTILQSTLEKYYCLQPIDRFIAISGHR